MKLNPAIFLNQWFPNSATRIQSYQVVLKKILTTLCWFFCNNILKWILVYASTLHANIPLLVTRQIAYYWLTAKHMKCQWNTIFTMQGHRSTVYLGRPTESLQQLKSLNSREMISPWQQQSSSMQCKRAIGEPAPVASFQCETTKANFERQGEWLTNCCLKKIF